MRILLRLFHKFALRLLRTHLANKLGDFYKGTRVIPPILLGHPFQNSLIIHEPRTKKQYYLMSTLKLGERTSTLEIFPGTSTLENEIRKYVQIRDCGWPFQKALGLGNACKVLNLVF